MSDEASFERFFAVTQALGGPERSAGRNASFRPTSGDDDVIAATSHDSFSGSFGQSGQISESFQDLSNNNPEKWTCRFQTTCAQLVFDRKRDWK